MGMSRTLWSRLDGASWAAERGGAALGRRRRRLAAFAVLAGVVGCISGSGVAMAQPPCKTPFAAAGASWEIAAKFSVGKVLGGGDAACVPGGLPLADPATSTHARKAPPSATGRKFANRSDQQALQLAADERPDLFAQQPTRTLDPPSEATVETYLDDYSARLDIAGQGPDVIATSVTPLRVEQDGVKRPVDLKLTDAGAAIEPKTPVVPLSFADHAGEGITIADNIRMRVVGVDGDAEAQIAGQQVFYANALKDADVFATPLPTGLETFVQLRSTDSPRIITYQFDLPDGARLLAQPGPQGGATIARGSDVLATIQAPVSTDANDAVVPTTMRIDGTHLVLDVDVDESTAMPVLVDPVIIDNQFINRDAANSNGFFQNTLGWRRETSGALANFTFSPDGDNPSVGGGSCVRYLGTTPQFLPQQLCVLTQTTRTYAGEVGQWTWRPPGGYRSYLNDGANVDTDAYIYRADVRHSFTRLSVSGGAYMYGGIRSGRTGAWIGRNNDVNQYGTPSDWRDGAWTYGAGTPGVMSNASFFRMYCAASDCSVEHPDEPVYDGASFAFGAYALGSGHALSANTQGAIFYQYDRTPPAVTQQGDGSNWKRSGNVSTFVSATDNGMGMKTVGTSYTNTSGRPDGASSSYGCTGGILNTCPRSLAQTFYTNVDNLAEGTQQIQSFGDDVLGKRTIGPSQTVKVDRSGPTGALTADDYTRGIITISGTAQDSLSGRGRWTLEWRSSSQAAAWAAVCTKPTPDADGSYRCAWDTSTLPEGSYQVRARMEDSVADIDGGPNVSYTTEVSWDSAADPALPDGSAGSGPALYTFRYQRAGRAWSTWQTSEAGTFLLANGQQGEQISVQVTATDLAGNVGALATGADTAMESTLTSDRAGQTSTIDTDTAGPADFPANVADESPGGEPADVRTPYQERNCAAQSPCGVYDGRAAARYARYWVHRRNRAYPSYGNDCTNFISQAMKAGGMKFIRTGGFDSPTPATPDYVDHYRRGAGSWWVARIPNGAFGFFWVPSKSWSLADVSRQRMLDYKVARVVAGGERPRPGDVVYYKLEGLSAPWSHASMITRVTRNGIYYAQHTRDHEGNFANQRKRLNSEKGPLGTAWTYQILRPSNTAYNLGS
jgi:hypothetical protein